MGMQKSEPLYFLSRFPRFMTRTEDLWCREHEYTLYTEAQLQSGSPAEFPRGEVAGTPTCYDDFMRAGSADVLAWPCLYVHRLAPEYKCVAGDVVLQSRAIAGAHIMGNITDVLTALDDGTGLRKLRKISVGGRNKFDVPYPDPSKVRALIKRHGLNKG